MCGIKFAAHYILAFIAVSVVGYIAIYERPQIHGFEVFKVPSLPLVPSVHAYDISRGL
jgi:hypothetical protein